MAKLYFRYGAMGSGKTMALLQVAFNYEERGQSVAILKPALDSKGSEKIVSRIGPSRSVDYLAKKSDNLLNVVKSRFSDKNCVLVDEAQFLTKAQINQLQRVAVSLNIPVIAYGLRCDGFQESWPGSRRLLEIADTIEELKTICDCGKKATLNCRFLNSKIVLSGPKILIDDGTSEIVYRSLCPSCYLKLTA